jgi:hypothetical protein
MEEAMKEGMNLLITYGLKVIGAIFILIVGRLIANWAKGRVAYWLERSGKVDQTLKGFLSSFVSRDFSPVLCAIWC